MPHKTQGTPSRNPSASQRTSAASLARHSRKCFICRHPHRQEIEEMFLQWFNSSTIHCRFLLPDRYTIYRHAHATGLYLRRRRNLRCAFENIIERSNECPISSNGIVRAAHRPGIAASSSRVSSACSFSFEPPAFRFANF